MTEPDEWMIRIGHGIELAQRGEAERAREVFTVLWAEIEPGGDPFHRLSLAHWMADLQEDPREELKWDLRALDAAGLVTDERARRAGVTATVAAFFPSLHLNLGEVYRKLGDFPAARRQLELGLAAVGELGEDGYGAMIARGLDGLAERLSGA
ncbi:hypothetical protein [Amycolatopsis sp. H20-H5]|uniref:hypothetical protein n=1 Tax=Amycolatopsis sp. H20-H5 TaxID=3046309 RepID=UPI002DB5F509|nr:hypothetical protein [Amycolatopsis sp. H20-H5]MEC3976078.1 hypothetical protein [Amycolatopsis sp. H20-H5]